MEKLTLDISCREECGTRQVAKLRKQGILPVVVYAKGNEAIKASVNSREFVAVAKKARTSTFIALKSDDKRLDGKRAFVKEIQQDHIKKEVLHVDLIAVDSTEKTRVSVPVDIFGESDGVKNYGGVLTVLIHQVICEGLPDDLPEIFKVDVTPLGVGQHFRVGDLDLPNGVTLITAHDQPIVSVMAPVEDPKAKAATTEEATPAKKGEKK